VIRINFAARKQTGGGGGGGGTKTGTIITGFDLSNISRFKVDFEALKELPLKQSLLPVVVGVLAGYALESYKESEISKLDKSIEEVNILKPKLQEDIAKLKNYEQLKKSLDGDEALIRGKIETIQKLIAGRSSPAKLLGGLSTAIPKEVWLSEFQIAESQINIQGYSLDLGHISDFMKSLGENTLISDLVLKNTR
jgi:hypothetical protein